MFCFFFQAEDGIRDATVTGVQTCALPISLSGRAVQAVAQQYPGLHEHVVGGDQRIAPSEQLPRAAIARIARVRGRIPDRRVYEQAQVADRAEPRPACTASATMGSLDRATSDPPEFPRLKTIEGSTAGGGPWRSRATRRRTYSAREMPNSEARALALRSRRESSVSWVRDIMMYTP